MHVLFLRHWAISFSFVTSEQDHGQFRHRNFDILVGAVMYGAAEIGANCAVPSRTILLLESLKQQVLF